MALASLAPTLAQASPFVVDDGNDFNTTYSCPVGGPCTLRDAVAESNASTGDDVIEITVPSTLERSGIDDDNTAGDLDFCKTVPGRTVTVRGVPSGVSVVWSAQIPAAERDRIFHVPDRSDCYPVTLILEGINLSGGEVTDQADGGGCIASHGPLTVLNNVLVHGCRHTMTTWSAGTPGGGGIQAHGALVLEESEVLWNWSTRGNGGGIQALGDVTIVESELRLNSAGVTGGGGHGGALHAMSEAVVTIERSRIEGNDAQTRGGGLFVFPSQLRIVDTEVVHNELGTSHAQAGGGLHLVSPTSQGSDPIIERSLFYANDASGTFGGGVYVAGEAEDALKVWNSTFSENSAGGGGAFMLEGTGGPFEVSLRHVTLHDNSSTGLTSVARVQGAATFRYQASLIDGDCGGGGAVVTDLYNVVKNTWGFGQCDYDLVDDRFVSAFALDPLSILPGEWTRYHEPVAGSFRTLCEIVPPNVCLPEDQRENPRPTSGACLAGSWEP